MSSAILAIIGVIWLVGGLLGAGSYHRMGEAEKPELKLPFPFFDRLYNKRIHAVATGVFLVGGMALILVAAVS